MFLEEKKIGEVKLEPWRQVLLDAADYMETHGHCKGRQEDSSGRVCLIGSLIKVTGSEKDRHPYVNEARLQFERRMGIPDFTGFLWNDRFERTSEEVIAAMRKVAYD